MRLLHTLIRISSLYLLALCAASGSSACEPGKMAEKYPSLAGKTIKVGQDGESPPFSFRKPGDFETLIGLDADMARAVFACVGIPITFSTGAWSGLIPAVMSGQIDVMWDTLLYTPERARRIDFVSYMRSATGALVPKGNPKKIKSLEDLCGLRANANLGTTQEAMLRQADAKCTALGKKSIEIITSTDMPSGLRLLDHDRADAVLTNRFLADRRVSENNKIELAFSVVTDAIIAVGVGKNNPHLVNAITDGLKAIRASGALKPIYEKYNVDYDLTMEPEVLTK